ncbi:MAG: S49 family peptidase [Alphaproteobacteria bacterium]|nr:S49 family peptidase [Alphaproteobacteria bacterium]
MFDRLRAALARIPLLGVRAPAIVPVVRLSGVIAARGGFGPVLSLASVAPRLQRAFSLRGAKAVALIINSPGGSPVQSALIARRIRSLAEEKKLPVHIFVEDVAASGGYWLACAGDDVYVDASSIVGSIGVISAGFGFTKALERLGVERRVHTAGDNKAMLDPFQPEDPDDVARLRALQDEMHATFKDWVRARRGDRLKGDDATLFQGEFWTGKRGLELGLVDGLGHLRDVLQARYGEKVRLPLIGERQPGFLRRMLGLSSMSLAQDALEVAEQRALWGRYGL